MYYLGVLLLQNCVITQTTNQLLFSVQFGDQVLPDVNFAQDHALCANSIQQLIDALNPLQEEAAKVGIKGNWSKKKLNHQPWLGPQNPSQFLESLLNIHGISLYCLAFFMLLRHDP